MRRALVTALTFVVFAAIGGPAVAAPPEVLDDFTETFDNFIPAEESCGDFGVEESGSVRVRAKGFFKNGELVRIQVHERGRSVFSHPETGDSVVDNWSVMTDIDLVEGTVAENGTVFNVNDRGQGIIVQDTGRIIFDLETGEVLEVHGPHEALDFDFFVEAVCNALSS